MAGPAGSAGQGSMNAYYERAFNLLRSDAVRRSFDINQEDAATRERYGRNIHGQSALLARRLVEAGVRFVSVYDKVHQRPGQLGHARQQLRPAERPAAAAVRHGLFGPGRGPGSSADCWIRRW